MLNYDTILLLTIAAVTMLAILVLGGLVLSARSYTALLDLVRYLGSLVAQLQAVHPQVPTTSLTKTEPGTHSVPQGSTPIMPDPPGGGYQGK